MSEPLDLAPIEARTQAATTGPWWHDDHEIYHGQPHDTDRWIGETCNIDDPAASNANGAFIAHARTDVPLLLAEVRRLRAELEAAKADAATAWAHAERYGRELTKVLSTATSEV